MFQFSGLALFRVTGLLPDRLPHSEIFGLTLVAAPRSLSQLTTSFIASRIQGIHRVPLIYLYTLLLLVLCYTNMSKNFSCLEGQAQWRISESNR